MALRHPPRKPLGFGVEEMGHGLLLCIEFPAPLPCSGIFVHRNNIEMMILLGWLKNNSVLVYQAVSMRKELK